VPTKASRSGHQVQATQTAVRHQTRRSGGGSPGPGANGGRGEREGGACRERAGTLNVPSRPAAMRFPGLDLESSSSLRLSAASRGRQTSGTLQPTSEQRAASGEGPPPSGK